MWPEYSIPYPIVTPMLWNTYYISTLDMILSGLLSAYLHIYISTSSQTLEWIIYSPVHLQMTPDTA